jgi:flavorubredoxin
MKISESILYAGVNDHQIDLFEGQFEVPLGMAYNSYVILDGKTAVMDTADVNFTEEWLGNVKAALGDRKPDYLVVHHMEPDHSASILRFLEEYPETTVVGNAKTFTFFSQFYGALPEMKQLVVKNGDTLELGSHTLHFVLAPMVHWPEVMMSYESSEGVLFSADAFLSSFLPSMLTEVMSSVSALRVKERLFPLSWRHLLPLPLVIL